MSHVTESKTNLVSTQIENCHIFPISVALLTQQVTSHVLKFMENLVKFTE